MNDPFDKPEVEMKDLKNHFEKLRNEVNSCADDLREINQLEESSIRVQDCLKDYEEGRGDEELTRLFRSLGDSEINRVINYIRGFYLLRQEVIDMKKKAFLHRVSRIKKMEIEKSEVENDEEFEDDINF